MGSNIQLIVVLIFLAFSGIAWVVRKFREQREMQRLEQQRARMRDEMLRTGRVPEGADLGPQQPTAAPVAAPVASDPKARLRELAEKRRAQLQDLKQRQAARGTGGTTIQTPRPAPARPVGPRGAPVGGRPGTGARPVPVSPRQSTPRPTPRPRPQSPVQGTTTRRQVPPAPPAQRPPAPARPRPTTRREVPARPARRTETKRPLTSPLHQPTSQQQPRAPRSVPQGQRVLNLRGTNLRDAIILSELLAPPVGTRPPGERSF